jgi:hypothetical protein
MEDLSVGELVRRAVSNYLAIEGEARDAGTDDGWIERWMEATEAVRHARQAALSVALAHRALDRIESLGREAV